MKRYGHIVAGEVIQTVDDNPHDLFHPDVAKLFVRVPNACVVGSRRIDGKWVHPAPITVADPEE